MLPSQVLTINWSGQRFLTNRQNKTIKARFTVYAFAFDVRRGYSPMSLFLAKAEASFAAISPKRWNAVRG